MNFAITTISFLCLASQVVVGDAQSMWLVRHGRVATLNTLVPGEMAPAVQPPPQGGQTEEASKYSITILQPVGETLADPYKNRLSRRPHTVPFEVEVQGLPAGLHALRLSIEGVGKRILWQNVTSDQTATFRGDIPLPPGPYRITLSVPDATATRPVTLEGMLPSYPYAPTKTDLDEWLAYVAAWEERGKDVAVAWGLCNLGRDYYLLGMLDKAEESLSQAIAIYDGGNRDPERFRNACQILAHIHLLRGDTAAMNAACERWTASDPTDEEMARFTFEWAQSLALLETDPIGARRLWKSAVQRATQAHTQIPPTPAWATDYLPTLPKEGNETATIVNANTPIEPAKQGGMDNRVEDPNSAGHDPMLLNAQATPDQIIASSSQILLEDDFDSENSGRGNLRHRGFGKWLVPLGDVDLIGNNFHDVCPGHGLYVDLGQESTEQWAQTTRMLQSRRTLKLVAGKYRVRFDMAGSHNARISVQIGRLGSVYKQNVVGDQKSVFRQKTILFSVKDVGTHKLTFVCESPEPSVLIDNIKLERLQTPGP